VSKVWPSAANATEITLAAWALRVAASHRVTRFHSCTVSPGPLTANWLSAGFQAAWAASPAPESITIRSGACASAWRSASTPGPLELICVDWSASVKLCCGLVASALVASAAFSRACAAWYWP